MFFFLFDYMEFRMYKQLCFHAAISGMSYLFVVLVSVVIGFVGASVIMFSSVGLLQIAIFLGQENDFWFLLIDSVSSVSSIALYFLFQLSGINLMYKEIVYEMRTIVRQ